MRLFGGSQCRGPSPSTPLSGCVLLLLVLWQLALPAWSQNPGAVSFAQDSIIVQEDVTGPFGTISIPLIREGGTSGAVAVSIQVRDPDSDFFANESVAFFNDGSSQTAAVVTVVNDNLPEGNETFIWRIVDTGLASVGSRSSTEVIISASDQPHGVFQFNTRSLTVSISEPATAARSEVTLVVLRTFGTFGRATVDYEVMPTDAVFGRDDVAPLQGQVVFEDAEASQNLSLSVLPDDIPESNEVFSVRLSSPTGGAVLANTDIVSMVTVLANDAPVRWAESVISVAEGVGNVTLVLTRGIAADGTTLGDISVETTVAVATSSGSASAGSDFTAVSTRVTFSPSSTSAQVSISILDDSTPEGDEMFNVILSSPSPDAVLAPPTTATVLIEINDDAGGLVSFSSPGPVVIQEDGGRGEGVFTIQRTVGTHGDLTVEWQVLASDGSLATSDFQPAKGNITMAAGVMTATLAVVAVDDTVAEEAESFMVELVRVVSSVGDLSDTGHRLASLIVADSDNVYGLLEWGQDNQIQVVGTAPRELMLAVVRSAGTTGIVAADYTIWYTPAGSTPSVVTIASVQLQSGQSLITFSVTLANGLFLEVDGQLTATLDNVTLIGGAMPLIQPSNSPQIGQRSVVFIAIPVSATSGFISFSPETLQVTVLENENTLSFVTLTVLRTGSFGEATITWAVLPQTAVLADIAQSAGTVTIQNGANSASFQVPVVADDVPEIDETFAVRLLTVAEANQMILPEQSTAIVTILANDNPSGIFSISAATRGPFFLNEDTSDSVVISIVRARGDLTRELVRFNLEGRAGQIAGGRGLADFQERVREVNVTLLVINDVVPELDEMFVFTISGLNSGLELATPTSVNITVLANDDFAGVFAFSSSSASLSIVEPRAGSVTGADSMATLQVVRTGGAFGSVSIDWEVTNPSADLTPTRGQLVFEENGRSATFVVSATPDDITEGAEFYNILLAVASGEGRVDPSGAMATVTIQQNDDPVSFERSFLQVEEGGVAVFTVSRAGQATDLAEVMFEVRYNGASESDVVVTPSGGILQLPPGVREGTISVMVLDDMIPEDQELLTISLLGTTGDAVLGTPTNATLIIPPNDDPNGLFSFSENSVSVDVTEGQDIDLIVVREAGSIGSVSLMWAVYYVVGGVRSPASTQDVTPVSGILTFNPGDTFMTIPLMILDDVLPELAEELEVELTLSTVQPAPLIGARLGNDSVAMVLIEPSDDPYGVLVVSSSTSMLTVAEDVPAMDPTLGSATVEVVRTFGRIGTVRVLWEVYPQGSVSLPQYVDLIFFGVAGPGVSSATPRTNTNTSALSFTGQAGSIVTVPTMYQPNNITNGFTISCWVRPFPSTVGVLVGKSSAAGVLYSLALVADDSNFLVRFTHRQSLAGQVLGVDMADIPVAMALLTDGTYHSVVMVVTGDRALLYIDGRFIDSRILVSFELRNNPGELTVGGGVNGNLYTGDLQDVRIYLAPLDLSQVQLLSSDAAALSLTPISGYLAFPEGSGNAFFSLSSVDDSIPEPPEMLVASLTNIAGGGRLGGLTNAIITILKSDSSNGVFGFNSPALPMSASLDEGTGSLVLSVNRSAGTFGNVTVTWEVREPVNQTVAMADFSPATGEVMFQDGVTEQVFTIRPLDEMVAELREEFVVVLTSAVVNDNLISSSPSSGASIDEDRSTFPFSVGENDFPYGVLQFSGSASVPAPPFSLVAAIPERVVGEEMGVVRVYVERAQGVVGDVSVEYFTSDVTATSIGLAPDYVSSAATLTFSDGVAVSSFDVTLLDDSTPELAKSFLINLTNPQGAAGSPVLLVGQSMLITIQPSDDAFGRFSFAPDSLSFIAAEGSGGSPVSLSVVRDGGSFSTVTVYWAVRMASSQLTTTDILPASGTLEFVEDQRQANFTVLVSDDMSAELLEVFIVSLVNVSMVGASVGSPSSATISVQANDHPYGLFVFTPSYRPLLVAEDSGRVQVVVTREFGSLGQVMVDVWVVPSAEVRTSTLLNTQVNIEDIIMNRELASSDTDYTASNYSLIFGNGDLSRSFYVNITEDTIPEVDEYFFAVITRVELNESSLASVDTSVLPVRAPGNDSIAVLVISENDDARGVVEFTRTTYTVPEPSQDFLLLRRSQGLFGNISVSWQATPGSADSADFSPVSGVVVIPEGVASMPLPLAVLDDTEPEFSEQFTVQLLSVSGGGRQGDVNRATVTIEASDDPNGAFEFAAGSRDFTVEEPADGSSPRPVTLTVQRSGGTVGVVSVSWRVTVNGADAGADVLPVTGSLPFFTMDSSGQFILSVLPDAIPEVEEVFTVELVNATGGANIGRFPRATITVPANDGPHGVIEFAASTSTTVEVGDGGNSTATLTITRSIGFFGDVRVFFTVEPADPASLALAGGVVALTYFSLPTANTTLVTSLLLRGITTPLSGCGRACLSDRACLSFSIHEPSSTCNLFIATVTAENRLIQVGVDYYQKLQEDVLEFYQSVASTGSDFVPVVGQSVVIPDGARNITLPVTILGDAVPELNESLLVTLTAVELITPIDSGATPILGPMTEATLIILENDDPRGRFVLTTSDGGSEVDVVEPDSLMLGVGLVVTRERGSIGRVSVTWTVTGGSAEEGTDFIGGGATLVFEEGEIMKTIALIVLSDDFPELDETIVVTLSMPTNGATIATDRSTVTVVIQANDGVAGVVGFSPLSRSAVVGEGESAEFSVERTLSALGRVEVNWTITGNSDPTLEFTAVAGTAVFMEGENVTLITVLVRSDATPELEERFTLTLVAIRTISAAISPGSGAATLDLQASTADITIRASNNPHGQVDFQTASLSVTVEEGQTRELIIVRQFGMFGTLEVTYVAENVSVGSVGADMEPATPGLDFVSEVGTVTMEGTSAVITIAVLQDAEAEVSEVFDVRLLSVALVGGTANTIPPTLGPNTVARVIIPPNDSPQGILTFTQDSYTIEEGVGSINITIARQQGSVGVVSVVYFSSNGLALNGEDYIIDPVNEVVFSNRQSEAILTVVIVDDTLPEVGESFCIGLRLPRSGAVIGNISETCVTILPNDEPYGVFSFSTDSLQSTLQETQGTATSNNVAVLRVIRERGLFGGVTVPYEVMGVSPAGAELSDLSVERGAVTFQQGETFQEFSIEAVADSIPELAEYFTVTLLTPTNMAVLSNTSTVANIEVLANQDPQGVLNLAPLNRPLLEGSLDVEEDVDYIDLQVTRSEGSFGTISVTVETVPGLATSAGGAVLTAAASQVLPVPLSRVWHFLNSSSGQDLLLLGTDTTVTLYGWRGVATPVQTLPAEGVDAITSFSPSPGLDVVVVANGGRAGNREVSSQVYTLTNTEQLSLVQSLSTVGASDVTSFQLPGNMDWYVVVVNGEDNTGNPNLDSVVYRWNGTQLVQTQILTTIGASAVEVFSVEDSLYMAITSLTDTRSEVLIWSNGVFRLDHTFLTTRATDVVFLSQGPYLVVTSSTVGVAVLVRSEGGAFIHNYTLSSQPAVKVERVGGAAGSVVIITYSNAPAQLYTFSAGVGSAIATPISTVSLPVCRQVSPFTLSSVDYLAAAGVSINSQDSAIIYQVLSVNPSSNDFYSRNLVLVFQPGETLLNFSVAIANDDIPEVDENFTISLTDARGGARLGPQTSVGVVIQSNDDAHGVVGFTEASLSQVVAEGNSDVTVILEVERSAGTFGRVVVEWALSGGHDLGEVSPPAGEVTFPPGVTMDTITLVVRADSISELNEVTMVTLTNILETGVPPGGDPTRGARLRPDRTQAVLTVQANDEPHGIVTWSVGVVSVEEMEEVENVVQLSVLREFGAVGALVISYTTEMAASLPASNQAVALMDYVPSTGDIVMADNQTAATISITILQDSTPESNESFLVNLTAVRLASEADRQGSVTNSPRINEAGRIIEVVIEENDNNRGVLSFTTSAVTVVETFGASVTLQVIRERGSFGVVGVDYVATPNTASVEDYTVPVSRSLTLESGQEYVNLTIAIVDDQLPELDETFEVSLVSPTGGAEIGQPSAVTITIPSNDDINGVFSFTADSLLILVSERTQNSSGTAAFTVMRSVGVAGTTIIYWEVEAAGRMDLLPVSGNLTFTEGVSQQMFSIEAVADGIPEVQESFTIRLVNIEGAGRIVDPLEARIAIQGSNDPAGVISLEQFPDGITIDEGDTVTVPVLRSAGMQGTVTVTWSVTPPQVDVFTTVTDTLVLFTGQTEAVITIQTLSDNIPEVQRSYSLQLVSSTLARINASADDVLITVRASDNPHGTVEFAIAAVTSAEDVGVVLLNIVRLQGLVGDLRVNISTIAMTADNTDYIFTNFTIIIPSEMSTVGIEIGIIDDALPELDEVFSVRLASVELLGPPEPGSVPPTLGLNTEVQITILASDGPFGTFTLVQDLYTVSEGGTLAIPVLREGGRLGDITVTYAFNNGRAVSPADFNEQGTTIVFVEGEVMAEVVVAIVDDTLPETIEDFTFTLLSVTRGSLGNITRATILIEASDSPFGVVGFASSLATGGVVIANPADVPMEVALTVERREPRTVATNVRWNVTGPDGGVPSADIDASTLSGTLTLAGGQISGIIRITVLPFSGDEAVEVFTVTIVSTTNGVAIDSALRATAITVQQTGTPFGIVNFQGEVLRSLVVVMEQATPTTLSLPLERSGQLSLTVGVGFTVSRVGGDEPVENDVAPVSGTIMFPPLSSQTTLDLTILADGVGEMNETFMVTLDNSTGGATLNPQASTVTFVISENGSPLGLYGVVNGTVSLASSNSLVSRTLSYTVVRRDGVDISSALLIQHSYQNTLGDVVAAEQSVSLDSSESSLLVTVPIVPGAYLFPGSFITITLLTATVTSPSTLAGRPSDISMVEGTTQALVSDDVANVAIGFTQQALVSSVNEAVSSGNVVLAVFRRGTLGDADVSWTTGAPTNSPFISGSLLPQSGRQSFGAGNTTNITLTARPASPHGVAEVFAVSLIAVALDQDFTVRVEPASERALIEPLGVLQLGTTSFSAVEGASASIAVWRQYGSMGRVTVMGVASVLPASSLPTDTIAAVPTTDFSTSVLSLTLAEGVTTSFFSVDLPNNDAASPLKVFQFSLLSVEEATPTDTPNYSSPRLSSENTSATVVILDDEGGTGVFQLRPTALNVSEGSLVLVDVLRSGGTSGRVAVRLQTLESSLATSGQDFLPSDQELVFDNGVSVRSVVVSTIDDSLPEFAEDFTVMLTQPAGQSILIDPNADVLTVRIEASDFPVGVFSFITPSLNLSEDSQSSGELIVLRSGGLMGVATIRWVADVVPGVLVASEGIILFSVGSTTPDSNIVLQLQGDSVPAGGLQFTVRLSSDFSLSELGFVVSSAVVYVRPRTVSVFLITNSSLTRVVYSSSDRINVEIRRTLGLQNIAQVTLRTAALASAVTVGRLTFQPAEPYVNFAPISQILAFSRGKTVLVVPVETVITAGTSPLAFQVVLESSLNQVMNGTVTVVLAPASPLSSLYPIYFSAVAVRTSQELEQSSTSLLQTLLSGSISGQDVEQSDVVRLTIDELIRKTQVPSNISYSSGGFVSIMMDIFNRLILDATFDGRSRLADSMKAMAYSLLEDIPCQSPPVTYVRDTFYFQAVKLALSSLPGRRFNSSNAADFVQFPTAMVLNTQAACVNVHYIEFFNGSLYLQPTFMSKVLSVGIQNITLSRTSEPVVFRINSNQDVGFLPENDHCLLWNSPVASGSGSIVGNNWDTTVCSPQTHYVLRQTFVQCACTQLGGMAVAADVTRGYGWSLPAGLSAALCIVVLLMAVTLHLVYRSGTLLASRLFMCLSCAVMLFQLILLVDIFASQSEGVGDNGCSALAALLQFTAIAQFIFIAIMVFAMWANFIGLTSGREPLVIYVIVGWGLAILVVVGTILIGRFAVGLDLNSTTGLYGKVNGLCFMPSLTASLLSTALPILLAVLVMMALLSHAGVYWSRWEDVRSLYLDSFNRTDVPLLIGFFAFLFLSSLAAYLHVYIALVYTFGIFVALNTLLCVYILVVYFFMSWRTLRKHNKYNIKDEVESLGGEDAGAENQDPFMPSLSMTTLGSSKEHLIPAEKESYSSEDPIVPLGMRRLTSSSEMTHKRDLMLSGEEGKDSHMDDLLFMLKTQNFSESFTSDESDHSGSGGYQKRSHGKPGGERFERRRISIADTHL